VTDSKANNIIFSFKPRDIRMQTMDLQANKGSDGQTNMITLRNFKPALDTFNPSELLDTSMVDFNMPGVQGIEGGLFNSHI